MRFVPSGKGDRVLLLVTIGLVVVALGVLIAGFVQHTLALIYASIACSAAAAVTLIVYSRLQKRRLLRLGAAVPAGFSGDMDAGAADVGDEDAGGLHAGRAGAFEDLAPAWEGSPLTYEPLATAPEEVFDPREGTAERTTGEVVIPAENGIPPARRRRQGRAGEPRPAPAAPEEGWAEQEPVFPIADYDDLRSAEILPLLSELDPEELLEVRAREESGRGRRTVLRRIDSLLASTTRAASGDPAAAVGAAFDVPKASERGERATGPADTDPFPIPNYGELRVPEILPLLSVLDADELMRVAEREREGAGRSTVLARISRLLGQANQPRAAGAGSSPASGSSPAAGSPPAPPPPKTGPRRRGSSPRRAI